MWPFGKGKKDKKQEAAAKASGDKSHLGKTEAQKKLLAQMGQLRAEIGEENLQRMAAKLRLEDLKNQVRKDIESDEDKRDRLLDELRFTLREDK